MKYELVLFLLKEEVFAMKQTLRKVAVFFLAFCLMIAMSFDVFAVTDVSKEQGPKTSVKSAVAEKDGKTVIRIKKPKSGAVYYKASGAGEKVAYSFVSYNTWPTYFTGPGFGIKKKGADKYYLYKFFGVIPDGKPVTYSGSVNAKKLSIGTYVFSVTNYAYKYIYEEVEDLNEVEPVEMGNEPTAKITFKVRKLKAPKGLSVKAGKKKVTVTFKKATGAKKYEIYKSKKKNSGYKKIKTTAKRKFVDKKVKTGKKYYYKVRSVRTGKGIVKSGFGSKKRTKRVK